MVTALSNSKYLVIITRLCSVIVFIVELTCVRLRHRHRQCVHLSVHHMLALSHIHSDMIMRFSPPGCVETRGV